VSTPNAGASAAVTRSSNDAFDPTDRVAGDVNALDDFASELAQRARAREPRMKASMLPRRINADETTLEKDLAKLVLSLIDVVRKLMERQAARRVNAGSLSEDEVERLGETFLKLDRRMTELRGVFGLEAEDLSLSLGPIHDLV
jgi:hypothetical protein